MEKINFKSYKCKKYRHIDKRIMIDRVIDYITDPEKVARHSFLPFFAFMSGKILSTLVMSLVILMVDL